MKIAMVSEHASPLAAVGGVDAGGQNVHVAELALALGRRGHDVVVHTRRDRPDLPDRVPLDERVTVSHLTAGPARELPKDDLPPYVPELTAALTAALADAPPDLLHAHFWMSGLAAVDAAATLGAPVVQTFHALGVVKRRHQGSADTSPGDRLRHERRLARCCTRVLASSTDERQELLRMGAEPDVVDIVPSGVDLMQFSPDGPRAEHPVRRRRYRLVTVSRLVPRKGVDDAIRALAQVPDAELLVAGGPESANTDADPEVRRLRQLCTDLGVADRVQFLGSVPHAELAPLLRSADAVLCLPWYEPFGIVPLEAMACGVPVVASAVGGLLDTVVDGLTGVHVPPRGPEVVAEVVRDLLADQERRLRFGANGAERATGYGWDEIAALVESSYLEALVAVPRPAKQGSAREMGSVR